MLKIIKDIMIFFLKKTIPVILLIRAINLISMELDFLKAEIKQESRFIPEFSYISIHPKNARLEILDTLNFDPLTNKRWLSLMQGALEKNMPYIICRRVEKNSTIYRDARAYIEEIYENDFQTNTTQIIETNLAQYFAIADFNGTCIYLGNSADLLFERENNILFRTLNICCNDENRAKESGYFLGKYFIKQEQYALAQLLLLHALENSRDDLIKKNKIGLKLSAIRLRLGDELERIIPLIQNFAYSILKLHMDVITEISTKLLVTESLIEQLATTKFINNYTKLQILRSLKEKENESCLTVETLISSNLLSQQGQQFLYEKVSLSPQYLSSYIQPDSLQEQKNKIN